MPTSAEQKMYAWVGAVFRFSSSLNDWKMMEHFRPNGSYVYNVIYSDEV